MQEPDFGDPLFSYVGKDRVAGQGFELPHHREHLFDVVRRQPCHSGASVRQNIDQTLRTEDLKCLAKRRARYSEGDA